MPAWSALLFVTFLVLGLRARPAFNVHVIAAGVTVVVLFGVAATEHLL
jgi:hypothetical protein